MASRASERLQAGPPLLLDAATGTELTRRGADTRAPLWSARALLHAPELLIGLHRENAEAGADVLTAATFRTHRRNLAREGLGGRAGELTALAVALAREGAWRACERTRAPHAWSSGHEVLLAGSLAPLEDCYRPDLVPSNAELHAEHAELAESLRAAGADLILVETMNCVRELVAAAGAAAATGLPVVASVVTDGGGRLLSGEPIAWAAAALLALERPPAAIGINCVPWPAIGNELALLAAAAPGTPLAAYANAGRPLDETDTHFTDPIEPREYAEVARGWLSLGVRLVGGCCGTTAGHTRALRAVL